MSITPISGYGVAKFIVSATAGQGNYTTIASALTAASSGDTIFVRTGSYTENLTLKAGVNIVGWSGDDNEGNVTIIGKATFSGAGTVDIANIRLQTNSDNLLVVSGSSASIVNLSDCYINCTNNTGISFTTSNTAASISLFDCEGDLGTTGIAYWSSSSTGALVVIGGTLSNSGNSTTASSNSAGSISLNNCNLATVFSTSSSGFINAQCTSFSGGGALNTACITTAGTGTSTLVLCSLASGTASALSIGAGTTMYVANCTVASTNTNSITGAGTINYVGIAYTGNGSTSKINTTTATSQIGTDFTKVVRQVFTSTGTYTPTTGMKYCDIEVVGGGGGSGATTTTDATKSSCAGGGGAGGYARGIFSAATIGTSQSVTIGAAGTAGTAPGGTGGTGGTTSVGALISATGGAGGVGGGAAAATNALGGAGGAGSSGDFQTTGQAGGTGFASVAGVITVGGFGGSSYFGGGGQASSSATANAGTSFGGGGGGGTLYINGTQADGAAGVKGFVQVTEYI